MLTKSTIALLLTAIIVTAADTVHAQSLDSVEQTGLRHYPNSWTDTYEVKFSDVHPELAAEIRSEIRNYRMEQLRKARAAQARGDRNLVRRIEAETQNEIRAYLADKKAQFPPTRVVVYGAAIKADMRDALQFLKDGQASFGQPLHVYVSNGQVITSLAAPAKYDMPLTAGNGGSSRSRQSAAGSRSGGQAEGGNGPSFGGLNIGAGSFPMGDVSVPRNGTNDLFGF